MMPRCLEFMVSDFRKRHAYENSHPSDDTIADGHVGSRKQGKV